MHNNFLNVLKILVIIVENETCKILHDGCIKYYNLLSNVKRLQWQRQCFLCVQLDDEHFSEALNFMGGNFLLSALNLTETHLKQLKPCHFAKMIWPPDHNQIISTMAWSLNLMGVLTCNQNKTHFRFVANWVSPQHTIVPTVQGSQPLPPSKKHEFHPLWSHYTTELSSP